MCPATGCNWMTGMLTRLKDKDKIDNTRLIPVMLKVEKTKKKKKSKSKSKDTVAKTEWTQKNKKRWRPFDRPSC